MQSITLRPRQPPASVYFGAIAQLVERVLCKHEVVGSRPSGSTTLRVALTKTAPRFTAIAQHVSRLAAITVSVTLGWVDIVNEGFGRLGPI